MRIYWIDDLSTGCGHVRTLLPMQEMIRRRHTCSLGYPRFEVAPGSWDALVLGRLPVGVLVESLPEFRKHGLRIIYDVDDALNLLEPDNPVYSNVIPNIGTYFGLLRDSNLVTTTTQELADYLREFVPESTNISVLPNCVSASEWRIRNGGNLIPRIGIACGSSHLRNLSAALEALLNLQRKGFRDRFSFVLFGISDSHEAFNDYYRAIVTGRNASTFLREASAAVRDILAELSHSWVKGVAVHSYPESLSALNLDLGLCPLRPSDFNRFKSCLKAYEYVMAGTEVLCSRVKPYENELPTHLFPMVSHDVSAWTDAIESWILEFHRSQSSGRAGAQRSWVLEHKAIEKHGHLWETAFSASRENG